MAIYHPVHIMIAFDVRKLLAVLGYLVFLSAAAVFVFLSRSETVFLQQFDAVRAGFEF